MPRWLWTVPSTFTRYEKMGLQEMRFHQAFEGATCIDAMEHICPEDWPGVLRGFWEALKPGGVLYFTVEVADARELEDAFEQAKSRGLPVVYGEQVSDHDLASGETAGKTIYHYYPSPDRVRAWLEEARFELEAEGTGNGYEHFVVRKE